MSFFFLILLENMKREKVRIVENDEAVLQRTFIWFKNKKIKNYVITQLWSSEDDDDNHANSYHNISFRVSQVS